MKILRRVLLGLVIVIALAVALVIVLINPIAKQGVQRGATYALGVPTTLDSMNVGLFSGTVSLSGLNVANPPSFQGAHMLRSGRFDLAVVPSSLLSDVVRINNLDLNGLDLVIDQRVGGSNISQIVDNLDRFKGSQPPPDQTSGKKVQLDHAVIRNVVAHVYTPLASQPLTVEVPQIDLSGVTSDKPNGVVLGDLMRRILPAILEAVVKQGQGILPPDVAANIQGQVGQLTAGLGDQAQKLVGQAQQQVQSAAGKAQQALHGLVPTSLPALP